MIPVAAKITNINEYYLSFVKKDPCHHKNNGRDSNILQLRGYIKARTLFGPFTRFYLSVTVPVGTEVTMSTDLAFGEACQQGID